MSKFHYLMLLCFCLCLMPRASLATVYKTIENIAYRDTGNQYALERCRLDLYYPEDNKGFAIMSGDKRVPPLLAITFEGELAPDTEVSNPGLITFLANAENYYKAKISPK